MEDLANNVLSDLLSGWLHLLIVYLLGILTYKLLEERKERLYLARLDRAYRIVGEVEDEFSHVPKSGPQKMEKAIKLYMEDGFEKNKVSARRMVQHAYNIWVATNFGDMIKQLQHYI